MASFVNKYMEQDTLLSRCPSNLIKLLNRPDVVNFEVHCAFISMFLGCLCCWSNEWIVIVGGLPFNK